MMRVALARHAVRFGGLSRPRRGGSAHRRAHSGRGGGAGSFALVDNLSVAAFDEQLHAALPELGVDVAIGETPYDIPMTTPFPQDVRHAAFDRQAVERFWRILDWTDGVFETISGWYCGKTSPVHVFWHSFGALEPGWDREALGRAWCPDPHTLRTLLGGHG